MTNNDIELNIQPQAGILGAFSRLNYKAWFAIGEFVDNSTASFFEHEKAMFDNGIKAITVKITYDSQKNTLTIVDDAYGMEIEDFERAIILDSRPENANGRNEFGMGLKTAASWFGEKWSVKSTMLGSENEYYTVIDINNLRENNLNSINISRTIAQKRKHGTTIIIENLTKKIDTQQTKKKIKELLSSMYRRDINSGKVSIFLNDELLTFVPYEPLNFRDKVWHKNLFFNFYFGGRKYLVTGFVGILAEGSYAKAGFALFRRNRVVIGGTGENYKPHAIFVQAQNNIALKLYGELNVDDFPVNQAKDGFVWDDGLEEEFIKVLKKEIAEYISIAKMSKGDIIEEQEYDPKVSARINGGVSQSLQSINQDDNSNPQSDNRSEDEKLFSNQMQERNNANETLLSNISRTYPIKLNNHDTRTLTVTWAVANDEYWIRMDSKTFNIIININHPFFKPYSRSEDFKQLLEKFVISYFLSIYMSSIEADNEGYILPGSLTTKMNEYLKKLAKE